MAASKSKTAGTSRRKTSTAKQTSRTAGDNEPGANLVNERANAEAAVKAQDEAGKAATEELDPKVAEAILNPGEAATSLNSLPKSEGGLPADVIAGIRSTVASARGNAALGQPGQEGHGVGTGTAGLAGVMSDEERDANEEEYRKRFS